MFLCALVIAKKNSTNGNYCAEAVIEKYLQQFTMEVRGALEASPWKPNVSSFC